MTYDIFMLNRNGVFSLCELPVILMKYLEFVSVILKHRCCRACIYYFICVRKIKEWFFKCNISWPSSYLKNIEFRGWEKEKKNHFYQRNIPCKEANHFLLLCKYFQNQNLNWSLSFCLMRIPVHFTSSHFPLVWPN